jgi:hypothetical protein
MLLDESKPKKLGKAGVAKVGRRTARKSFCTICWFAAERAEKGA